MYVTVGSVCRPLKINARNCGVAVRTASTQRLFSTSQFHHVSEIVVDLFNQLILLILDARHGKCPNRNLAGDKMGNCGKDKDGNYIPCHEMLVSLFVN